MDNVKAERCDRMAMSDDMCLTPIPLWRHGMAWRHDMTNSLLYWPFVRGIDLSLSPFHTTLSKVFLIISYPSRARDGVSFFQYFVGNWFCYNGIALGRIEKKNLDRNFILISVQIMLYWTSDWDLIFISGHSHGNSNDLSHCFLMCVT